MPIQPSELKNWIWAQVKALAIRLSKRGQYYNIELVSKDQIPSPNLTSNPNSSADLGIQKDKLLATLTTMKVGGAAKEYLAVTTIDELKKAFFYAREHKLNVLILGKGSNILCADQGFDGLVIHNKISFISYIEEENALHIHVGSGFSFSLLGTQTAQKGYTGLEFASGIPASVGGALFMNAGANGCETCDALMAVDFLDLHGKCTSYTKDQLSFAYRSSSFQEMKGAIIGAYFVLHRGESAREKQLEIIQYRKKTQPLSEPSCGCIFRNPPNQHAGALIDQCGLKESREGNAGVSPLHANFIINHGGARAKDIEKLIEKIQAQVYLQTGIHLESEIRKIPYQTETPYDI